MEEHQIPQTLDAPPLALIFNASQLFSFIGFAIVGIVINHPILAGGVGLIAAHSLTNTRTRSLTVISDTWLTSVASPSWLAGQSLTGLIGSSGREEGKSRKKVFRQIKSENVILKMGFGSMMFVTSLFIFNVATRDEAVILIPPFQHETIEFINGRANKEFYSQWAWSVSMLAGNITPRQRFVCAR